MYAHLKELLGSVVRAPNTTSLAKALCMGLATRPAVALVRLWISDAQGALALAGSAGTPSGGGSYARTDGEFREMAIGAPTIEAIASGREPFIVSALRGDEAWLTNPSWAARQGVRAFVGLPLVDRQAAVGVLALFDRTVPSRDALDHLALVVDVAAARVADFQAREIAREEFERPTVASVSERPAVITRADLRRVERANIEAALVATQGKIFGEDGAARLLDMKPTTLASRIKALGIER